MSVKRKRFIVAGSIISILHAILLALIGIVYLQTASIVKPEDFDEFGNFKPNSQTAVMQISSIEATQEEQEIVLTEKEKEQLVEMVKVVFSTVGGFVIAFSVASLAVSVLLISNALKGGQRTGLTIALLVFSIVSMDLISAVLLILALSMKPRKITLADIEI